MKKSYTFTFLFCLFWIFGYAQNKPSTSKDWTRLRSQIISNVSYDLTFYIPSVPDEKVTGMAVVTFTLPEKAEVALDFTGRFTGTFIINDKKRKIQLANNHIIIPMKYTRPGANRVAVSFESKDNALKRNNEYLYTCFKQGQVSSCFPCFDQPDIRATFTTHMNLPEGWKTMASNVHSPISPHLYSFIAGHFDEKVINQKNHQMRMFYRQKDITEEHLLTEIIEGAGQALEWMEDYTGLPYPFEECGLLFFPGSQFASIDYVGAIRITDPRVFSVTNETATDKRMRNKLIAHETAHLWFGNITSARSRHDIWVNEVLANFMATKMDYQQHPKSEHNIEFLTTSQARALAADNKKNTYSITQAPMTGGHQMLLNDTVINDKGAVMMRFLEEYAGEKTLQTVIQKYLRKYFYKSASWEDFIIMLDEQAPEEGLRNFNDVWAKQKGMPTIHTTYQDGQLIISQIDPNGQGFFWQQKFEMRLIYDFESSRTITVDMREPTVSIKLSDQPSTIIPNYNGRGYGHFTMDEYYTKKMPLRIMVTRNDLNRYALLMTIFDNYLMGRIPPSYFGELYRDMTKEKNPLIMRTAIDHMMKIATDLPTKERQTLEQCITDLLPENRRGECKQAIIRKMAVCGTAPEVIDILYRQWQTPNDPLFNEHDYMEMAYRIAIMRPQQWQDFLKTQRQRLSSDLLREEFDYVSRACNPDAQARKALSNALKKQNSDQQQSWVQHAQRLLNSR